LVGSINKVYYTIFQLGLSSSKLTEYGFGLPANIETRFVWGINGEGLGVKAIETTLKHPRPFTGLKTPRLLSEND